MDIGCGWGGFARNTAEKYGIRMYGLTISRSQLEYARASCEGLDCTFRLGDYRQLPSIFQQKFDAITIIGVTEQVGYRIYRELHRLMRDRLKSTGLLLEHTIAHLESCRHTDPFIDRYIFPGGMVPSLEQLSSAMKGYFVLEGLHNFGADYDPTLMAWSRNISSTRAKIVGAPHLGERFYRLWEYYLISCAAMFWARQAQLIEMVMSPTGVSGGYLRISRKPDYPR